MKRMLQFFGILLTALVCATVTVGTAQADGLTIQSFDKSGKLSFSRVPTATVYRVE